MITTESIAIILYAKAGAITQHNADTRYQRIADHVEILTEMGGSFQSTAVVWTSSSISKRTTSIWVPIPMRMRAAVLLDTVQSFRHKFLYRFINQSVKYSIPCKHLVHLLNGDSSRHFNVQ